MNKIFKNAPAVNWIITSTCNNHCKFCYACKNSSQLTESQINDVIQQFKDNDVKIVTISGGEPLMQPHLTIDIIKKLKDIGCKISLSTNGYHYLEFIDQLEPYIDKLSLGLDGFDMQSAVINGRNPDSFEIVEKILQKYKNGESNISIKIATVLSKKNASADYFKQMAKYLSERPVKTWKIYQFIPQNVGAINAIDYSISDETYNEIGNETLKYLKESNIQIATDFVSRNIRNRAYCIINPNGDIACPIEDKTTGIRNEVVMGNLTQEKLDTILQKWSTHVNEENVLASYGRKAIIFKTP